jgi:hypothetical protein
MNLRHLLLPTLPVLFALLPCTAPLRAQNDPEAVDHLRREQDEVLRKAERLRDLMLRLVDRYEREKKPDQVKLLREGLAHLERSGVLHQVASIRDDIAATAYTEAVRKQKEVVDDLERLLNILLERKSIENLDRDLAQATEQAKSARELEQRQRELIDHARDAMRSPPSATEQQVLDALQALRDAERREAESNARQAGTRRPALENALERVREMLHGQDRLEQGLADEANGRTADAKAREFDLGELLERTRELQGDLRDQAKTQALRDASRDLQRDAGGSDQAALQQSRDRLESQMQQAPKRGTNKDGKAKDPAWSDLKEKLRDAGNGASEAEREKLRQVGDAGDKLAEQRDQEATASNAATAEQLRAAADKLAEKLAERTRAQAPANTDKATDPAAAVDEAKQLLAQAAEAEKQHDTNTAQAKVNEALAALDRARSLHQQQNPDAQKQAGAMAAESHATSQDLQNAPNAEQAEQDASKQLDAAERALRDVEAGADKEQPTDADRAQREQGAASSRKNLEAAKQTLEQALQGASQNSQQEMKDATARQQELQQAAAKAGEQVQKATSDGALQKQQSEKTAQKLQQARDHMQNAQQRLQSGQQSNASQEQQAAAESLQQAMEAIDQNRPTTDAQKQQLQQQAKAQQQLADDIVRLAQELAKRDNKNAERKAQQAADAAKKAQRAMEQGDPDETEQQQEEARKDLEQAAKELEQEIDRYQDLRQEELLFRMKDELTTFLDRQRPISEATVEAQKSATSDGLSRAMRTKVNQLGEEEQELSGKIDYLVQALDAEGNLVYRTVLKANVDDLREVARRLAGRRPDVAPFTTLLQQDVERRTVDLLAALERERQRREQERKDRQEQQQQDRGKNRFDPQRKKLVGLIAELEMLKKLGTDTRTATDNLKALVEARGEDVISDAEVALIERLAQRHNEITKLFQQIKAGVEQTLQGMQGQEGR